jgi:hypothetical protein
MGRPKGSKNKVKSEAPLRYAIVEVPVGAIIPDYDEEVQKAIRSLDSHPGFEAVLNKLRLQKALVESALKKQKYEHIEDYYYLQAMVHGLEYTENFLKSEVKKGKTQKPRESFDIEAEQFQRISAALQMVGGSES